MKFFNLVALYFLLNSGASLSGLSVKRRWLVAVFSVVFSSFIIVVVLHISHEPHFAASRAQADIGKWALEMSLQTGKTPDHYIHLYNRLGNRVRMECLRRAQPGEDPSKYRDQVWKELSYTTIVSSETSNSVPGTILKDAQD